MTNPTNTNDLFKLVLKQGTLLERGMPRFQMLTDDQIRQIHAYIRSRARDALGKGSEFFR